MRNKVLGASLLALALHANAATVVYSERGVFNASTVDGIVDGYDSETYGWNPGNPYGWVLLTDATMNALSPEATYTTVLNSYVGFTYSYQPDGGAYCSGCNGDVTISFLDTSVGSSNGVYGVGFDLILNQTSATDISQHKNAIVTFGNGSAFAYILPDIGTAESPVFWGITSNSLIASISFVESGTYSTVSGLVLDNLTVAASPVPVPGALWLFGSGLFGLAGLRVRRTRQHSE